MQHENSSLIEPFMEMLMYVAYTCTHPIDSIRIPQILLPIWKTCNRLSDRPRMHACMHGAILAVCFTSNHNSFCSTNRSLPFSQSNGNIEQRKFTLDSFVTPYRLNSGKQTYESTRWEDEKHRLVNENQSDPIYYVPANPCTMYVKRNERTHARTHVHIFMLSFR